MKSGVFPPDTAHVFSRLMKYREEADYHPSYVFASGDYSALRHDVETLIRRIREHLKACGYL